MKINTNVSSLTAQEAATNTNRSIAGSLEKLSTGLKINKLNKLDIEGKKFSHIWPEKTRLIIEEAILNVFMGLSYSFEADYTVDSWNDLKISYNKALKVLENKTATQEQVDKAYDDLDKAIKGLIDAPVIVDKKELSNVIETTNDFVEKDYTVDSWKAFKEALDPSFKDYMKQVVKNADTLANALIEEGFDIVSGGTDNHLMLVDLKKYDLTGKEAEKVLDSVHITCNKNTVPNDPKSPFVTSGLRLGTPAVTTRGLKEDDMKVIAKAIRLTLLDKKLDEANELVLGLTEKYPLYE